jgi:hypothetical protein
VLEMQVMTLSACGSDVTCLHITRGACYSLHDLSADRLQQTERCLLLPAEMRSLQPCLANK